VRVLSAHVQSDWNPANEKLFHGYLVNEIHSLYSRSHNKPTTTDNKPTTTDNKPTTCNGQ